MQTEIPNRGIYKKSSEYLYSRITTTPYISLYLRESKKE